jgi:cell division septum initiation protein DivIVA
MWKTVLTALKNLLTLARDLEENRQEIKELNEKIYGLASAVRSLSDKIDANAQQEASERRALILRLENDLLRAGREVHSLSDKKHARRKKIAHKKVK